MKYYYKFKAKYQFLSFCAFSLMACTNGTLTTSNMNYAPFGQAYQFNGTSSYVQLAGTNQNFTSVATIEFFFQTNFSGATQYFFNATGGNFDIFMNSGGTIQFNSPNAGGCTGTTGGTTSGSYNDGNLHYLTVVHTNSNSNLYIDGYQVQTFAHTNFTTCTFTGFYIGSQSGTTFYFSGLMDEFRFSNVTRYGGSFSIPQNPFQSDGSTLDLFHFDNSTNNDFLSGGGTYNPINISKVFSPFL